MRSRDVVEVEMLDFDAGRVTGIVFGTLGGSLIAVYAFGEIVTFCVRALFF